MNKEIKLSELINTDLEKNYPESMDKVELKIGKEVGIDMDNEEINETTYVISEILDREHVGLHYEHSKLVKISWQSEFPI